ncbi:hypothetical protein CA54_40830 [Symmachiella macrocystis]|uniref:Uncharacterized protein n=1 Tax=Symmachiella macrocystis TaxID=2527985 RepID=A0A5C6BC31_9PLAN|nr:hypothetical protein CA54_40830 [Symmachiella macrocystis]
MATSNTPCGKCKAGRLKTYAVNEAGGIHTRYLRCDRCRETAKQCIAVGSVRRRLSNKSCRQKTTPRNNRAEVKT